MKFRYTILLMVLVALAAGCKSKNDDLALYKEGKIKRGEFYNWMEARNIDKERVLKLRAEQKSILKLMGLEKLVLAEADKGEYEKNEDFKFGISLIEQNFLVSRFKKGLNEGMLLKQEAVKARLIKLHVPDFKLIGNERIKLTVEEQDEFFMEREKFVQELINEIKMGANFKELARKHSSDVSAKNGGDIGYITRWMYEPAFISAAFSLKAGEYTKIPVRVQDGLCIIKVEERVQLTEDSIDGIIKDKEEAERFKARLKKNSAVNLEQGLAGADDVKDFIDRASLNSPGSVLFAIGDRSFTSGDLNEIIDYMNKKSSWYGRAQAAYTEKQKRDYAVKFFREMLIAREARKHGFDSAEDYKAQWGSYRNIKKADMYKLHLVISSLKPVTAGEIAGEYNKNKTFWTGDAKRNNIKSLKDIQAKIKYTLHTRKISNAIREFEMKLLKEKDFKIIEEQLEGV